MKLPEEFDKDTINRLHQALRWDMVQKTFHYISDFSPHINQTLYQLGIEIGMPAEMTMPLIINIPAMFADGRPYHWPYPLQPSNDDPAKPPELIELIFYPKRGSFKFLMREDVNVSIDYVRGVIGIVDLDAFIDRLNILWEKYK